MGELGVTALVISVAALLTAAAAALDLSRDAPRGERRLWIGGAVVLVAAAVLRVFAAFEYVHTPEHPPLPASAQVSLLLAAVMLAGIAVLIRPLIQRFRRADRERLESEERFRRALSAASDPVGMIDGEGVYTYVNDAGCVFFAYPREQILGRHFRDFIADVDPSSKGTVDRAMGYGAAQVEREVRRGDGTAVPVLCDLIALGDGSVLVIGHDLTANRDAEAARASRLEAISTLAAGVAHDFNNLLSVIGVSLDLAIEDQGQPAHLDRAARATSRASDLAHELMDFARATVERAQRPPSPTADARSVVSDAVDALREGLDERIALEVTLPPDAVAVAAEPSDLHRICTNLLTNARDAVQEALAQAVDASTRGRVDVSLSAMTDGPGAARAELVVRDTGTGMPAEVRERVFEPFFTTKGARVDGRGYGLGLAATRELVVELNGTIAVESEPGAGTAFTVRLPVAAPAPAAVAGS